MEASQEMSRRGKGKRAARYVRVSTAEQHPELQADETADLIRSRGWELVGTYIDRGVSGARERRPELSSMLDDARKRKFDVLVVWRSDRLFRSLKHMVNTLAELSALGIDFVSVTEPFDTCTPQGRLLLHLVSAFGEFERAILIERTRAGVAAARRRGARLGRPQASIDLLRARALRAQGVSVREVAATLGVKPTTLYRALGRTVPKSSPRAMAQVLNCTGAESKQSGVPKSFHFGTTGVEE
jgi:DNA invertase Pin-like site-specific DNA recombinase